MYSVLFPFTKPYSLSVQGSAINPMIYVYVPMFLTSTVKLMSLLTLSYLFPSFSLSSDWVFLAKLCHIISLSPLLKLTSSDLFFSVYLLLERCLKCFPHCKEKKKSYLPTYIPTDSPFIFTYILKYNNFFSPFPPFTFNWWSSTCQPDQTNPLFLFTYWHSHCKSLTSA